VLSPEEGWRLPPKHRAVRPAAPPEDIFERLDYGGITYASWIGIYQRHKTAGGDRTNRLAQA